MLEMGWVFFFCEAQELPEAGSSQTRRVVSVMLKRHCERTIGLNRLFREERVSGPEGAWGFITLKY
jgi:hypothetical protein